MRSEAGSRYLLKAIEAFKRRLIVVSPKLEILAANCGLEGLDLTEALGWLCHQFYYGRPKPCINCAVQKSKETGRPAQQPNLEEYADRGGEIKARSIQGEEATFIIDPPMVPKNNGMDLSK